MIFHTYVRCMFVLGFCSYIMHTIKIGLQIQSSNTFFGETSFFPKRKGYFRRTDFAGLTNLTYRFTKEIKVPNFVKFGNIVTFDDIVTLLPWLHKYINMYTVLPFGLEYVGNLKTANSLFLQHFVLCGDRNKSYDNS